MNRSLNGLKQAQWA
jgi:hypothetical protein